MTISERDPDFSRSTAVATNIHSQKLSSEAVAIPTVYSAGTRLNSGLQNGEPDRGGFVVYLSFPRLKIGECYFSPHYL